MALTNIFNEPRREVIEQGMGLLVVAAIVAVNVGITCTLSLCFGDFPEGFREWFVASFLSALIMLAMFIVVIGMHAAGEALCNSLARHGHELRPRNRRFGR